MRTSEPMNMDLAKEIAGALHSDGQRIETMPDEDPRKATGLLMSQMFTSGVDYLRTSFPNARIRKLMVLVWDIVGHRIVPVAMLPKVDSLTLALMGNPITHRTAIFMPSNWLEMVKENPILQMGALVFVGSQAVDIYNQRAFRTRAESQLMSRRARAYEAEYLLAFKNLLLEGFPALKPNDYQRGVLDEYPHGLDTAPELIYESKPFVAPS